MLRITTLAGALALGLAAPALAQHPGPSLLGGGDNTEVVYNGVASGSIVGGGNVVSYGGDDNRTTITGRVTAQRGLVGRLVGGGENAVVVYAPLPVTGTGFAGTAVLAPQG